MRSLHLFLPGAERIRDLVHAGVLTQPALHLLGCGAQPFDVRSRELHVDVVAGVHSRHVESDLDGLGNRVRGLPPEVADLLAGEAARLGRQQLDRHLAHVRRRKGPLRPQRPAAPQEHRLVADRRRHVPEVVDSRFLPQPGAQPGGALFEPGDGPRRGVDRGALRHRHRRRHEVGLEGREELEVDPAAEHHPAGQNQRRETDRRRDVPPLQRGFQNRRVHPLDDRLQSAGEEPLEAAPPAGLSAPGDVRQVSRQDAERLDEGEEQARNHDERNYPEELADHARHQHQRHERGHRGQNREGDRLRDLSRALDGAAQSFSVLLLMAADVLADDDGVVDHDP